jgi:hypothetical protein
MARQKRKSQFALSGRRPSGTIDERKFYLIVTEGKTEAEYFNHFQSTTGPRIESVDKQDSKVSLVKKAITLRDQLIKGGHFIDGDETWVVFDRDIDKQKPNDKDTFNQAIALAKNNGIEVAYSNDCFELWFLLHFQAVSTALHRRDVVKKLKQYIKSYKHGDDVYDALKEHYAEAVKRAKQMLKDVKNNKKKPVDANPSTTVHILTDKLLQDADQN